MENKKVKNWNLVIIAGFILVSAFLLHIHENWRDEAQAWLLARELSPQELIAQMKYEGHPCLWHFILMPFAKLGFPYVTTNLISIFFVTLAVAFFLYNSPMHIVLKLVLVSGSALCYFYGAISRSYCLIPILLFLLAALYRERHTKSIQYCFITALLVQTHIIMLPTAGLISLFFLAETLKLYSANQNRSSLVKKGCCLCLPLVSFALLLVQVGGATESSAFSVNFSSFSYFFRQLGLTCFLYWGELLYEKGALFLTAVLCSACAAGVILAIVMAVRTKDSEALKAMSIACISIACQLLFSAIIYHHNQQRYFTFLFIWVWLVWVLWPVNEKRICTSPLVAVFILMSLASYLGYADVRNDIAESYSGSKECAEFINASIPKDAVILQSNTTRFTAVVPYLDEGYQIISLETGEADAFATWKHTVPLMESIDDSTRWVKERHPEASDYWLIIPWLPSVADTPSNEAPNELYQWLFSTGTRWLEFENYTEEYRIRDELYAICRIEI